jgi:hypothetical protein
MNPSEHSPETRRRSQVRELREMGDVIIRSFEGNLREQEYVVIRKDVIDMGNTRPRFFPEPGPAIKPMSSANPAESQKLL